ncbi:MAG: hypothetical protein A2487_07280 [Candidatus Raymondbacteria bacterium RifOxyC12_full_50_8]|uniref:Uncharacterized protein n=1 Tax=Candidatus Raymondbacteria bacterium RIFOXYD12_FULL_49_13 TaxID=1817890 RepID=A0A1F7F397_UNCRA|nr:MAG: hypothetical protein A2248_08890 [Candidatus Raymondbacteria bacterium RIFOXYA2_FULL_49_16]OGJ96781.1 MAG: hypothetical protein A2487_07280 [Candidatus Raymondbacteria bacterium RifOxyC12_full_50_8]OGK01129.1 MAG: hypothetical protein A2519_20420 [Candidatus Raymondbacteria bacterium RIFOXYD12_FULL_49_13]OGP39350.1 MAG: hypothetical protein A2324_16930 [Candidatus Raymondbacteria bacterium RIFOXYB2_FULL_49_35]
MVTRNKLIAVLLVGGVVLAGCGKNPFGPGAAGGLDLFAKIGKAMGKPSAINEEENGKEGAKSTVTQGAAKQFLARGCATQDIWQTGNGLVDSGNGILTYWETVVNKPDNQDPLKKFTGKAEVSFRYGGAVPALPANLNASLITDVISWKANGREIKTWHVVGSDMEIDTINVTITFSAGSLQDPASIRPGYTTAWGKNISVLDELGKGDTASFELTSLDEATYTQVGHGSFFDAKDDNGESHTFAFDLQIIHKNSQDPTLPYLRYEDNEGVVTFTIPWGETGDSLFFNIHFYPATDAALGYREVTIYKNTASGEKLYYSKVDAHGTELETQDYTNN